jgi:predicted ATPase
VQSATDIFSFGVIIYLLATGKHPFESDLQTGILQAILYKIPLPPSYLNPEIPPALDSLILSMLEKSPRLRPSAAEIDQALAEILPAASLSSPGAPRFDRQTVGREPERRELLSAFESAVVGRGHLLCLTGESGIGKTTIVEDFLADLTFSGRPAIIARGRCSERLVDSDSYLPFLDALESMISGSDRESILPLMKLLTPCWYAHVVPQAIEDAILPRDDIRTASPEKMKREMSVLLHEAARLHPLVLFLDDIHWADISTVDLLAYLATKLSSARILIIVTYRPADLLISKHPFGQLRQDLVAQGIAREIPIGFLSPEDIKTYLSLVFPGHQLPDEFSVLIHTRTEGNPLFTVNLLRYLQDKKVIADVEGSMGLGPSVPDIERVMPESVRSLIERKIGQFDEIERHLLLSASVQGQEFDSAVVSKAAGLPPVEVEERLDNLQRIHGFVRLVGEKEFPDRTLTQQYRFVHVLYQNALYNSLRPTRRATICASVADALAGFYGAQTAEVASELALLYELARDFGRASDYFLLAARNALSVFGYREAIELSRRGLDKIRMLPDTPERARRELMLLINLGVSLTTMRGYGQLEVEQTYTRARQLEEQLGTSTQLLPAIVGLGAFYFIRGDMENARKVALQLLEIAERPENEGLLGWTQWIMGMFLGHTGELPLALDYLELCLRHYYPKYIPLYLSLFGMDPLVGCHAQLGRVHWLLGYPDKAKKDVDNALQTARDLAHPYSYAIGLFISAWVCQLRRDAQGTLELVTQAVALSHEQGYTMILCWAKMLLGWALTGQGKLAEGILTMREALAEQRASGSEIMRSYFLALFGEALAKAGQREQGLSVLGEALLAAQQSGDRFYEAEIHRLMGELLLLQAEPAGSRNEVPDFGDVEAQFWRAIEIARKQSSKSLELRAMMSLSRLHRTRGLSAAGREGLAQVYSWFTEGFDTPDLKEAKILLAEIS